MKELITTTFRASFSVLALGVALAWLPGAIHAQSTDLSPKMKMAEDSVASRMAVAAMLSHIGARVTHAAQDTALRPWRVDFPVVEGSLWSVYRENVLRAVRGRSLVAADSSMSALSLRELQMVGDTLVGRFYIASYRWCDGRWKGGGSGYAFRAIRDSLGRWGGTETRHEVDGDSVPCSGK
jgi:hypothetical protein